MKGDIKMSVILQLVDDMADLQHRVLVLEQDNEELSNKLEAVTNELAYVDAYQDNQQVDIENLEAYIAEVEDAVNFIDDAFTSELEERTVN